MVNFNENNISTIISTGDEIKILSYDIGEDDIYTNTNNNDDEDDVNEETAFDFADYFKYDCEGFFNIPRVTQIDWNNKLIL